MLPVVPPYPLRRLPPLPHSQHHAACNGLVSCCPVISKGGPIAQVASLCALYDAALQRQMGVMIDAITPKTTNSVARYRAWSGQVLSRDQTRGKPFPRYLAGETWPNQTKPEPERGLKLSAKLMLSRHRDTTRHPRLSQLGQPIYLFPCLHRTLQISTEYIRAMC